MTDEGTTDHSDTRPGGDRVGDDVRGADSAGADLGPADAATLAVGDHLRAGADDPLPAGVYRVVGTGDPVALLAITEDGHRAYTGRLEQIDPATAAALAPAADPDAGLGRLRQVPRAYAAHRVLTSVGLLGLAVGLLVRWDLLAVNPTVAEILLLGAAVVVITPAIEALR